MDRMIRNQMPSGLRRKGHESLAGRLFKPRVFAIIALIFLIIILIPLAKNYNRKRMIEKEIEEVQREIADFEGKNKELKDLVAYLQSDQSLEEQARLNMGMKRPGETVAVIQDSVVPSVREERGSKEKKTNPKKWLEHFMQ